ncbi:MAG TPA: hypothetical protein VFX03_02850, partial [Thermomicrobiales bacterium]|nr:hypothetical protein [Thermomicrobiales bacterium]
MDSGEMRQLLHGYLRQMPWKTGVTKDDLLARIGERDDTLRTMVDHYLADGTYYAAYEVMDLLPAQAWQDAQGDVWRGGELPNPEGVSSNFLSGPVGSSGANRAAGAAAHATPHAGEPGDGAGRTYDPQSEHAGVWPVSGPPIPDPNARPEPMASFG